MAVSKKVERKLRRKERRYETEQLMKEKRSEEYDTLEEVFDRPTLVTVYRLLDRGTIEHLHGVVSTGKEARVYWGVDSEGRDLAVKIYLTTSAEFKKGMLVYIRGDPRFKHVRQDTRSLIYAWAKKEFKNLQRAYDSGVRVPKPFHVEKNVLITEFIGEDGTPAPLIREKPPAQPKAAYQRLLEYVRTLYQKAGLVHGDLSEYNIMNLNEELVIFDISQAVPLEHPMSDEFLRRDLNNLNRFFEKLGGRVKKLEDVYRWVTESG